LDKEKKNSIETEYNINYAVRLRSTKIHQKF